MEKYQEYVNEIKINNKFFLVVFPIILVLFLRKISSKLFLLIINVLNEGIYGVELFFSFSKMLNEIIMLIIAIFLMTSISKLSVNQLGFTKEKKVKSYFKGVIIGITMITIVFVLIFLSDSITVYFIGIKDLNFLIKAFVMFLFQGLREELMYRSYLMPLFSKAFNNSFSILATSVLFTWIHLSNPNLTLMAVFNLFVAGIMFALIYYYTGNIWVVGGIHSFWNFFIANVFGSQVSGIIVPNSIFMSIPNFDKELLSGGMFGFEASIITLLLEIFICLYIYRKIKKERNSLV